MQINISTERAGFVIDLSGPGDRAASLPSAGGPLIIEHDEAEMIDREQNAPR
jgi:hypothetical protein